MRTYITCRLRRFALTIAWLLPIAAVAQGNADRLFSPEQLDQMTAQVALYPDTLLSQVLMASTYPDEVAQAATWSRANADKRGDEAVALVENEPWEPSVQSLVAFPQVTIMMGENPDWVRDLGDAFLAQPDDVMASVQRLRARAQTAGTLSSSQDVRVATETVTVEQTGAPERVIVIQQASPDVVYVPTYNPTIVYGAWPYPSYPPVYIPPPPGYWFSTAIAAGIAWGVGIGIRNALWGNVNWGRRDININVNRYNNIYVNRRLTGTGVTRWNHNVGHRGASAYRGGNVTRQQLDRRFREGQREQYRARDGDRARALQAMQNSGVNVGRPGGAGRPGLAAGAGDRGPRPGVGATGARPDRPDRGPAGGRPEQAGVGTSGARPGRPNAGPGATPGGRLSASDRAALAARVQAADRNAVRESARAMNRDSALRGVNDGRARAEFNRGVGSRQEMQRNFPARNAGSGARPQPRAGAAGGARPQMQMQPRGGQGGGRQAGGAAGGGRRPAGGQARGRQ